MDVWFFKPSFPFHQLVILLAKSLYLFVRATASPPAPSPRSGEGWGEAVALWIRQQYLSGVVPQQRPVTALYHPGERAALPSFHPTHAARLHRTLSWAPSHGV